MPDDSARYIQIKPNLYRDSTNKVFIRFIYYSDRTPYYRYVSELRTSSGNYQDSLKNLIDKKSFRQFEHSIYARDKHYVYYYPNFWLNPDGDYVRILEGADPRSFKPIGYCHAKDKKHVYYKGEKIKGCNSRKVKPIKTPYGAISDDFIADSENIFFKTSKIHSADYNTFELIESIWPYFIGIDKNGNYKDSLLRPLDSLIFCPADLNSYGRDYIESAATGDFNKDGNLDIATVFNCYGSDISEISILHGKGDGRFSEMQNIFIGKGGDEIAVTDFDNDHINDIVLTDFKTDSIYFLKGSVKGTFKKINGLADKGPSSVACHDFNLDGKTDFAVTHKWRDSIDIFLNTGNFTFNQANKYQLKSFAHITAGDFTGDSIPDIVCVDNRTPDGFIVFKGDGTGNFIKENIAYYIGYDWWSITGNDFNHDGIMDIAISDYSRLFILVQNQQHTFTPYTHYAIYHAMKCISSGDVNNDGIIEIITQQDGCLLFRGKPELKPDIYIFGKPSTPMHN